MTVDDYLYATDDFHTYGTYESEETFTGCGGEFCPGPKVDGFTDEQWWNGQTPFLCAACRAGTVSTVMVRRPYGSEG